MRASVRTDSAAALGEITATYPDLVLMDIRIDGQMDGVEAAARIQEQYRLPVIFITVYSDRQTLERAKLTGPFGYLVKPVAPASSAFWISSNRKWVRSL